MEAERPLARGAAHPLWPLFVLALGAGVLALVLAHPAVDESWENHPAHFWLVLTAAAINVALGYAVGVAARRRRDARLFLVSLAFVSAAGFLGLHALATPGVLIGKNAGFELATPVGLVVAGVFAAASGFPLRARAAERVLSWAWLLTGSVFVLMAIGRRSRSPRSGRSPASWEPSSWTAGRSRWPRSASSSTRPPRSATTASTADGAFRSCSGSHSRSRCSRRRCS